MTFAVPPWNAGRKRYIVKRRELVTHERGTVSKVRRVRKFTPWAYIDFATSREDALAAVERAKSRGGLYDYAIFYDGKRVST